MPNVTELPISEFIFTFSRSSGSGGQNVNKVNSRATLHWDYRNTTALSGSQINRLSSRYKGFINKEGTLSISCDSYRDQARNRTECIERLQRMVQSIWRPPAPRIATKPSRAARKKRVEEKQRRGSIKATRKRWNKGNE